MNRNEQLVDLLARVQSATGPDCAIDLDLWQAIGNSAGLSAGLPFTASVDASLRLVETNLPGAVWHVMTDYGDLNRAKIGPKGRPEASIYRVEDRVLFMVEDAETPPLAILAALLAALIAEGQPVPVHLPATPEIADALKIVNALQVGQNLIDKTAADNAYWNSVDPARERGHEQGIGEMYRVMREVLTQR